MDSFLNYWHPVDKWLECEQLRHFDEGRTIGSITDQWVINKETVVNERIDDEMAEVLERLNAEAEEDVQVFGSEAERLAASAPQPRQRKDGDAIGTPVQRRFKGLTDKQQTFIEHIVTGKPQRLSYRLAYPDDTSNDMVITTAAARLLKHPMVIKALQEQADTAIDYMVDDQQATRRWITTQLMISATASKQEGSRLKALELLGRSAGMFQPQQVAAPETMSAIQLKAELDKHLTMLVDVTPRRRGTGIPVESSPVESTGTVIPEAVNGQDGNPTTPPAPQMDAT